MAKVSGTVTLDGEPLAGVLVTFTPIDGGRGSIGTTDEQGRYSLIYGGGQGALIGEHKVSVTTIREPEAPDMSDIPTDSAEYEAMLGSTPEDYEEVPPQPEPIPARFNTQTELVRTVEAGQNVIDLELSSR